MALELTMENLTSMIDNVIAGICVFEYSNDTEKLKPLFVNEGFFRMLGYSRAEGMKYLKDVTLSIIPEDLKHLKQAIKDVLKDDGSVETEFRTVTGTGGLRWVHVRGNLYAKEPGKHIIVAVVEDATERKSIEEELRMQAERLHILSEAEGERIIDYNAKTDVMIIKVSTSSYGAGDEIIINQYFEKHMGEDVYSDDSKYFKEVMNGLLKSPKHDTIEYRTHKFDDQDTWYQINLTSLLGTEGYVTRIVGRLINVHERKLKELDLLLRAEKDALTGLYNKGATLQLICNDLTECKKDVLNALMIIDLDNFKEVNDSLGHATGDQVLIDTATALSDIFKGGDIVGRIGGDEFVVYMKNLNAISNADVLASKVCKMLDFKLPNGSDIIHVTCSIGIAIFPYHGTNYDELFNKADKAVYTAKANGKNGYRIYDAATTMVYHATRKNTDYNPEKGMEMNRSIEDLIMQILLDDKMMVSALKTAVELITKQFGFHRAFICGEEELMDMQKVQFAISGYEMGAESKEHYELRKVASEILYKSFRDFKIVHDYDLNSEEMHDFFKQEGIKSMLYYPITAEGVFKGAIVYENHEDVQLEFSDSKTEELRSLLRILEAHILQIGLMDRLQDFATQIAVFDNMDSYVYIINKDTYQISFINKKVLMQTPNVKIGDICYKALQNKETPCENCILHRLDKKDAHSRCSEEAFNYSMRCWCKCSASWLECKEENALALVNMIDISEYFAG